MSMENCFSNAVKYKTNLVNRSDIEAQEATLTKWESEGGCS